MKRRGQDWRTSSEVVAVSGKLEPPHYSLLPSGTSQSSFRHEGGERHKRRSKLSGSQQIQFPVMAIQNIAPRRVTTRIQAIALPMAIVLLA